MIKFKITCPDCETTVITSSPRGVVWELCPSCKRHIWDIYDALMADVIPDASHGMRIRNAEMNN